MNLADLNIEPWDVFAAYLNAPFGRDDLSFDYFADHFIEESYEAFDWAIFENPVGLKGAIDEFYASWSDLVSEAADVIDTEWGRVLTEAEQDGNFVNDEGRQRMLEWLCSPWECERCAGSGWRMIAGEPWIQAGECEECGGTGTVEPTSVPA